MKTQRKAIVAAFTMGLLFGGGLVVGGMTQPAKVVGFLDFFGNWDPSLAFVMGGALLVVLTLQRFVIRRGGPLYAVRFGIPSRNEIDVQLLTGAALFGVGWGIAGFCPGPGFTAVGAGVTRAWIFVAAMLAGFGLVRFYEALSARKGEGKAAEDPKGRDVAQAR